MSTLHVLSHSPFTDNRLESCLRLLGENDGVLLCGDAAYALMPSGPVSQTLQQTGSQLLFVLDEDLKARNLALPDGITRVDYAGFVELSIRFDKVNTWL
ncbi:sulfurtransferase complex subunit TusB [Pseudomonas alliivorans]|uniref:Sulfurtransferase complex subunit TusB n=1 Tax=Pseudomonas alliivorans TaxID=2810613 RepID=A0ABS4C465_9PSED|nr:MULTISPECIES: sulfurtransferase complex subunit TusB [Pseudomonas]MBP0945428.1 sulfurtransferase complex subunit TusB [Pseudomonas alliivorans]MBP0951825.1 sulfurtransferase complex subunit TusB [Pseudomonas alliivorans]MEE4324121.1 sulfurtransferase complex subunit TusB [Pseudomonas alliivorans]MEE4334622.1 sulfurtransferase complex subunit TusB [Pseudomonas alliivorans]MEE4365651.1 sulfurtransferase complex subunit TusB [Pseudomonas alliivorans]